MRRDPAIVLRHGVAVEDDVIPDVHGSTEHHPGEHHGSDADATSARHAGARVNKGGNGRPGILEQIEQLGPPGQGLVAAPHAGAAPLPSPGGSFVVVTPPEPAGPPGGVGEAAPPPPAFARETPPGPPVPACAKDQEPATHAVLTCAPAAA